MSDVPPDTETKPAVKKPAAKVVKAAKSATARVSKAASKVTPKQLGVGAAIGIGSAAIVAALLYANRSKKR